MAIGGIAGALLAGLEGYSQARQKEQQDQRLRQDLLMRQQAFAAEQQLRQRQEQAMGIAGLAAFGGMPGMDQVPQMGGGQPMGGGPPDQMMPPSPPRTMSGQGVGGGLAAGGALTGNIPARGTPERERLLDRIAQDESGNRNIPQGVVPPGGGFNPSVGRVTGPSTAGGPWQITDSTLRDTPTGQRTGARSAMALPVSMQREAANDLIDKRGLSPWAPYNPAVRNDPVIRQIIGAAQAPEARQTATQVAQTIDPIAQGRASLQGMVQQIEKVAPDADPATKFGALMQLQQFMAPYEKIRLEQAVRQHQEQFELFKQSRQLDAEKSSDITIQTDPQNNQQYVYNKRTKEATTLSGEPYAPGGAQRLAGSGAQKAPHNIEVTDTEGKTVYKGAAVMTADGFTKPDGSPIEIPVGGSVSMAGTGGGRQAATQIQAIIGSGNELLGELNNLMDLPKTATLGIFQGLQGMPANEMGEAMKRSLSNKMTPEEQTDLLTSFQGVARSLATIEAQGRATGLVGLTEQARTMAPQAGDSIGNVLRKMATMRQILERGLETVQANRDISPEQKVLMQKMLGEVTKTIPFTVSEVNKMQHGDVETLREAAKKLGLSGGGAGGATQAGPQEGDTASNPQTGEKLVFKNGAWVKQ